MLERVQRHQTLELMCLKVLGVGNPSEDGAFDPSFKADEKVSREVVSETLPEDIVDSYPELPILWSYLSRWHLKSKTNRRITINARLEYLKSNRLPPRLPLLMGY